MTTPSFRDIARKAGIFESREEDFCKKVKSSLFKIQSTYVQEMGILDKNRIVQEIKSLWSKIEPLMVVDKNDIPEKDASWLLRIEFRQDFWDTLKTKKGERKSLFCRVALFLLEDENENIIISRRSPNKMAYPGSFEIAGGHVIVGDSYLETIYKELWEELRYIALEGSITEKDRLFKYRNSPKWPGEWNILCIYRVRVSSQRVLVYDPEEIEELVTLTKEELYEAISTGFLGGEEYKFIPHHAYWYLEYLEQIHDMDTHRARKKIEMQNSMLHRTKMETFWDLYI